MSKADDLKKAPGAVAPVAGAATAGAVIGSFLGPVGAAVGTVIGAVVGGVVTVAGAANNGGKK